MSSESTSVTPISQGRKRELTSPEFDKDSKKYKTLSASPALEVESTMATDTTPNIVIPESELLKLSEMLKDTFQGQIVGLVNGIVEGVLDGLLEQITKLEKVNTELTEENQTLRARVQTLELKADQAEQYSRRNCLRISGFNEDPDGNTDNIVMQLAADIDSDVQLHEVDRSHRVGNPTRQRGKPRDIIIKFATYRSRQKFYRQRKLLKERGHEGVFVNEDLTKHRSALLFEARKLSRVDLIQGAWSSDGNILVKDNAAVVHRINKLGDLFQFGYLVMGPGQPVLFHRRPADLGSGARAGDRSFAGAVRGASPGGREMDHSASGS